VVATLATTLLTTETQPQVAALLDPDTNLADISTLRRPPGREPLLREVDKGGGSMR
jgi:hypothetical protein